ncbi:MAG: hypothetical protein AB7G37_20675 [Solirubrobacteraceae bacterium]
MTDDRPRSEPDATTRAPGLFPSSPPGPPPRHPFGGRRPGGSRGERPGGRFGGLPDGGLPVACNVVVQGWPGRRTLAVPGLRAPSLRRAWIEGEIHLSLLDPRGRSIRVTAGLFDAAGDLLPPPGYQLGAVTASDGRVTTFAGVERLTAQTAPADRNAADQPA